MTDLEFKLNNLRKELVALKTAERFSSVVPAFVFTTDALVPGKYIITYEQGNAPIFSNAGMVISNPSVLSFVTMQTPSGNSQKIELAPFDDQAHPVVISSNRKILKVSAI